MNWAHWHMILVHFPIAGTVIALIVLIAARLTGNLTLNRFANLFLIITAWSAFPAALTGGPSQDQLKPISEELAQFIDRHAMISLYATWLAQAAACFAIVNLLYLYRRKHQPLWLFLATIAMLGIAAYFMAWCASLGGEIVHLAIRGHQILPAPKL
jgi:uncharacterized membrane protein